MSLLTIFFGVLTAVLAVLVVGQLYRSSKRQEQEEQPPKREAKTPPLRVTEKIAEAQLLEPVASLDADEDLSQSGMVSIQAEIDRCVAAERWDEAISWALHAVESRPGNHELKVKLAEIYHMAGDREGFMALFEELKGKLANEHELRRQLLAMARKTMPGHDSPPLESNE